MRQLADQMRNNPQSWPGRSIPIPRCCASRISTTLIERMERLSRSGDKEAAKQLLDQLQQMLENLQMAQPGQYGDSEMEQALNELGDMIRKQQQTARQDIQAGPGFAARPHARQQAGRPGHGRSAAGPAGLRDRLKNCRSSSPSAAWASRASAATRAIAAEGRPAGPGPAGDQVRRTVRATVTTTALARPIRRWAMPSGKLGEGNADAAVDSQGKALMRSARAPRAARRPCQQGDGDGQGDWPGERNGRQQPAPTANRPAGKAVAFARTRRRALEDGSRRIDVQRCAGSWRNCAAAWPIRTGRRSSSTTSSVS